MIKVSKATLRPLLRRKRLPKHINLFAVGSLLYDILEANDLHKVHRLWNQTYWVSLHSQDRSTMSINWQAHK
jgi:hypothetical protein